MASVLQEGEVNPVHSLPMFLAGLGNCAVPAAEPPNVEQLLDWCFQQLMSVHQSRECLRCSDSAADLLGSIG